MSRTAIDTSVIVAAHLSRHDHHKASFKALAATLEAEESIILPLPALTEAYAVLTRFPTPDRLSPADAFQVLQRSFREVALIVSLSGHDAWPFFADLSQSGYAGGVTYDFHILACAVKGGAERILTLNTRHFERLKPEGLQIVNPLTEPFDA